MSSPPTDYSITMKAIVQSKYGSADDLELKDIDRPVVKDDEVLVRVRAASVHPDVWHVLRGRPYVLRIMGSGVRKPKSVVPGTDVAGQVESVGKNVTRFQAGDDVFGESIRGYQWRNGGAYAEYVSVPAEVLALKPSNLTYEQAAAVPTAGLIALQGIRHQGDVQPGQKVLVNGAGGGVGIFAVQLAKSFGAEVTGVDSTSKVEILATRSAPTMSLTTPSKTSPKGTSATTSSSTFLETTRSRALSGRSTRTGLTCSSDMTISEQRPSRSGEPAALLEDGRDVALRAPTTEDELLDARQEGLDGRLEGAARNRRAQAGSRQNVSVERGPRGYSLHGRGTFARKDHRHRLTFNGLV